MGGKACGGVAAGRLEQLGGRQKGVSAVEDVWRSMCRGSSTWMWGGKGGAPGEVDSVCGEEVRDVEEYVPVC